MEITPHLPQPGVTRTLYPIVLGMLFSAGSSGWLESVGKLSPFSDIRYCGDFPGTYPFALPSP